MKAFDYYKQMSEYITFEEKILPETINYFRTDIKVEDVNIDEMDSHIEKINWYVEQHEIIFLENANDWINSMEDDEAKHRMADKMIATYKATKSLRENAQRLKDLLS